MSTSTRSSAHLTSEMDQDAFRSLLSKPRQGGESSRSRGTLGGARKDRFNRSKGKGRSAFEKERPKDEAEAKEAVTRFRPRSQQKAPATAEQEYKDRAAMRRQGDGGEYKHVEQVLADFERRKAEAGTDADKVETQRAFLGGDAEHSVLVKGLDFALLAKRKAELEREKGAKVEDELDALGSAAFSKPKPVVEKKPEKKESSKFKSIGDKGKGKAEEPKLSLAEREKQFREKNQRRSPSPPPRRKKTPSPPPNPEEEEDIFADAGAYDLNAGRESDDDDSDEDGEVEAEPERGRSRSRSRGRDSRSWSRSRSRSRDRRRYDSRSRSRSYDRYDRRQYRSMPRSRSRSRSYDGGDRGRRRYPPSPRRYDRSRSRSYDRYDRGGRYDDRRYRSHSRTPPRKRAYSRSRSRTPPRRRSPSPKRQRQRTRSLSPAAFDPANLHALAPSDSESDDDGPVTRLRPLEGGSISARDLLAMDQAGAAADQRAIRKYKMRAAQGLGAQEGFDMSLLHDKKNDGHRLNREYQAVMNQMKKGEKK